MPVYKRFEVAHGELYPVLPGDMFQTVDGCEGHVVVELQLADAPCLAFAQGGVLLGVPEAELDLEPGPVNLDDVVPAVLLVVRGEVCFLPLAVLRLPYDDFHRPFEGLAVHGTTVVLAIIILLPDLEEHLWVKVVKVNLAVIEFGPAALPGLPSFVKVHQHCVIAEPAHELHADLLKPVDEWLLGEERVGYNGIGQSFQPPGHTLDYKEIPQGEREFLSLGLCLFDKLVKGLLFVLLVIRSLDICIRQHFHDMGHVGYVLRTDKVLGNLPLPVNGLPCAVFGPRCLYSRKHDAVFCLGIDDAYAKDLKSELRLLCASRPKVTHARSMLAGVADVARVYRYGGTSMAAFKILFGKACVEADGIELAPALTRVVAICLLTLGAIPFELRIVYFVHNLIKN